FELATTDAKVALEFYGALFGWERAADHDMGPMGFYYVFGRNGREMGGAFDKPPSMPGPPGWLGYVRVKNIEKVVKKARAGGATLINGPMDVPGGDRIAQLVDPQGAMFALHVLSTDLHHGVAAKPTPEAPATIEVTGAPRKKTAVSKVKPKAAKKAARPVAKSKRTAAKTMKRSVRKAVKVPSRTSKAKARTIKVAGRKKSVAKASKKKTQARARKGK
ncbi:MAG TPA: VOC family protein, partial [Povalibacter sp.]